jgi:hypothetical protein
LEGGKYTLYTLINLKKKKTFDPQKASQCSVVGLGILGVKKEKEASRNTV